LEDLKFKAGLGCITSSRPALDYKGKKKRREEKRKEKRRERKEKDLNNEAVMRIHKVTGSKCHTITQFPESKISSSFIFYGTYRKLAAFILF
jgi:hypothetical protein